ncbi:hypothetical protein K402DRAFT_399832 [Aulographum hederae CBS 113979]|uniref:Uncharacterized protein n=1 Tax=Aulographum hederae CBS 113979 TaxID=1176131 RepID=A0A6G1HFE3_9PEZI|nr:hypothetical protein K402DRAFT_399832 [Aulographum hederae CBS 113979]
MSSLIDQVHIRMPGTLVDRPPVFDQDSQTTQDAASRIHHHVSPDCRILDPATRQPPEGPFEELVSAIAGPVSWTTGFPGWERLSLEPPWLFPLDLHRPLATHRPLCRSFTMVLGMIILLAAAPGLLGTQEAIRQGQSKEKREEHRSRRCNLIVSCVKSSTRSREIDGRQIVLRDGKLYIDTGTADDASFGHPFAGYYLPYPDSAYEGLVTTITDVAPILNWCYIDKDTHEVRYGVRVDAQPNFPGPFDCTRQDRRMTFDGWEGFVAVEEEPYLWAVYFDRDDDALRNKVAPGTRVLEIELTRKEKRWKRDNTARAVDQSTQHTGGEVERSQDEQSTEPATTSAPVQTNAEVSAEVNTVEQSTEEAAARHQAHVSDVTAEDYFTPPGQEESSKSDGRQPAANSQAEPSVEVDALGINMKGLRRRATLIDTSRPTSPDKDRDEPASASTDSHNSNTSPWSGDGDAGTSSSLRTPASSVSDAGSPTMGAVLSPKKDHPWDVHSPTRILSREPDGLFTIREEDSRSRLVGVEQNGGNSRDRVALVKHLEPAREQTLTLNNNQPISIYRIEHVSREHFVLADERSVEQVRHDSSDFSSVSVFGSSHSTSSSPVLTIISDPSIPDTIVPRSVNVPFPNAARNNTNFATTRTGDHALFDDEDVAQETLDDESPLLTPTPFSIHTDPTNPNTTIPSNISSPAPPLPKPPSSPPAASPTPSAPAIRPQRRSSI